jgi:hypothetical protein
MAQYNFDEGGGMAAYFALSLLVLILIPATWSLKPAKSIREDPFDGCKRICYSSLV